MSESLIRILLTHYRGIGMKRVCAGIILIVVFAIGMMSGEPQAARNSQADEIILRVGVMDDCPPYNFFNDRNEYVGMNIDIIREMGRRTGRKVVLKPVSYNRLMMGLLYKQYDVVAAPQSMNPYREETVRFLAPYHYSSDAFIYHPERTPVNSLAEIKRRNLKIGVFNGTSYPAYLEGEGLSKNIVIYPTQREMYLAFLSGKVDVIMADTHIAAYYRNRKSFPFGIADEHVRHKAMAFSTRKEDVALAETLEAAFQSMQADGTLNAIRERWLNPDVGKHSVQAPDS